MIHRHTRLALALTVFTWVYSIGLSILFMGPLAFWVLGTFFIYNHDGSDK